MEIISVKLDKELKEEIDELARERLERRSDLIRSLLRQLIRQEKSKNELKKILGRRFVEGKITFEDLVKVLGYEEAKKIVFCVDIIKKSLIEGVGSEAENKK